MPTLHLISNNGQFSASNYPIKENGVSSEPVQVTDEEYQKVFSQDWKITDFSNGILTLEADTTMQDIADNEKAIAEHRAELKEKIESGQHTQQDLEDAIKLIL